MDFKGRTAIVTGAGSGIGAAIALSWLAVEPEALHQRTDARRWKVVPFEK
ncbi:MULTISPECIES: 3-ketoacyl-ACP reductase [unclassified Mesorhizobium]|nr:MULTISPECIES: 3-ketoacyl-ACP reductase [unclassified Mesorhizobium]MDG4887917.1 3-ketoacyl-ACP reductase [Mesorhizobium sp. WSM4887]